MRLQRFDPPYPHAGGGYALLPKNSRSCVQRYADGLHLQAGRDSIPPTLAFSHFWDFPTRGKITTQTVYTCEQVGIRSPLPAKNAPHVAIGARSATQTVHTYEVAEIRSPLALAKWQHHPTWRLTSQIAKSLPSPSTGKVAASPNLAAMQSAAQPLPDHPKQRHLCAFLAKDRCISAPKPRQCSARRSLSASSALL